MTFFIAFFTGFACLALEVLGTQICFSYQAPSSKSVAIALSAFLIGLGLSNYLTHLFREFFLSRFYQTVAICFAVAGVYLVCVSRYVLAVGPKAFSIFTTPMVSPEFSWSFYLSAFVLLFFPALFLGPLFPLTNDYDARFVARSGARTGLVNFFDLLGASLGALMAGFVFVPLWGLEAACLYVGWFVLAFAVILSVWQNAWRVGVAIFIFALGLSFFGFANIESAEQKLQEVLFDRPSKFGRVRVIRDLQYNNTTLLINSRSMCGVQGVESEKALASLPLSFVPGEKLKVLNIGLGCGITASEVLKSSKVEKFDVVEINSQVIVASKKFASGASLPTDARVRIIESDGFSFLQNSKETYDLIIVDIEEPSILHSSPLFTADFFKIVKSHLKPKGIFSLWSFYQPDTGQIILNTLRSVFARGEVVFIQERLVFLAGTQIAIVPNGLTLRAREELAATKRNEVATVADNPYAKYFKIHEIFNLPFDEVDPFEMKEVDAQ